MQEKSYIKQVAIAFDQLCNALFFNGWADETMSSAIWRMEQEGRLVGKIFRPLIDLGALLFNDVDHCRTSFESEKLRNQSPPEAK